MPFQPNASALTTELAHFSAAVPRSGDYAGARTSLVGDDQDKGAAIVGFGHLNGGQRQVRRYLTTPGDPGRGAARLWSLPVATTKHRTML